MTLTTKELACLELVASAGNNGLTESLLAVHGFDQSFLVNLCRRDLLICRESKRVAGGKVHVVCWVLISEGGKMALEEQNITRPKKSA